MFRIPTTAHPLVQTVQSLSLANSTTALTLTPNPSWAGETIALTANVTGAAALPTGNVTFYNGITELGSATLSNVNGAAQATLNTSVLPPGVYVITAVFNGNGVYNTSTSTATQTVTAAHTSLALSLASNPSPVGQPITITASFTSTMPSGAPAPTGTFTLSNGSNQVSSIAASTLSNGKVTFTINYLAPGSYTFTVNYSGDSNYLATSQTIAQTVIKANTSVALTSSANPFPSGKPLTLTAFLTSNYPIAPMPGGTVTFYDGGTSIGTGTLHNSAGQDEAYVTLSSLAVGANTITASYAGDTNYNSATSGTFSQTILNGATTLSVTSSLNPSAYGQTVTFNATVSAVNNSAIPSGSVTFYNGTWALGTVASPAPQGGPRLASRSRL